MIRPHPKKKTDDLKILKTLNQQFRFFAPSIPASRSGLSFSAAPAFVSPLFVLSQSSGLSLSAACLTYSLFNIPGK